MEMNYEYSTGDEAACTIVCAPLSQLRAVVEEKLKEGFVSLGPPFGTGAKVNIEGQEVPEMGQAMTKREPTQQTTFSP
jgi:hypothetical protein